MSMSLLMVNFWAVLLAALSAFLLGGMWYSKLLFGKIWCREVGLGVTQDPKKKCGHGPVAFIVAFIFSLVTAYVFAVFLGRHTDFYFAVACGFAVGLFFVATSFGINYMFAGRSLKLLLIDAGYHVLQFTFYGAILGLWH